MNKRKYTIKNNLKNQQLPFKDLISEVYDHSLESPKDHDTQFVTNTEKQISIPCREQAFYLPSKSTDLQDLNPESQCSFTALYWFL